MPYVLCFGPFRYFSAYFSAIWHSLLFFWINNINFDFKGETFWKNNYVISQDEKFQLSTFGLLEWDLMPLYAQGPFQKFMFCIFTKKYVTSFDETFNISILDTGSVVELNFKHSYKTMHAKNWMRIESLGERPRMKSDDFWNLFHTS